MHRSHVQFADFVEGATDPGNVGRPVQGIQVVRFIFLNEIHDGSEKGFAVPSIVGTRNWVAVPQDVQGGINQVVVLRSNCRLQFCCKEVEKLKETSNL